uniref:Uncharacterized protein n=1 Tax=Sphaerodactylus townsendi TaxID=933632 RepID=A0ACB8FRR1_9SAUR
MSPPPWLRSCCPVQNKKRQRQEQIPIGLSTRISAFPITTQRIILQHLVSKQFAVHPGVTRDPEKPIYVISQEGGFDKGSESGQGQKIGTEFCCSGTSVCLFKMRKSIKRPRF